MQKKDDSYPQQQHISEGEKEEVREVSGGVIVKQSIPLAICHPAKGSCRWMKTLIYRRDIHRLHKS